MNGRTGGSSNDGPCGCYGRNLYGGDLFGFYICVFGLSYITPPLPLPSISTHLTMISHLPIFFYFYVPVDTDRDFCTYYLSYFRRNHHDPTASHSAQAQYEINCWSTRRSTAARQHPWH
ncbi:hypothetical protein FB45DRAFT_354522 [Roridomyces roridus]|uniref:Uncharacterized protein n=1 Tax=Roridomyces roridus TaxID=1738132 RepID=A0AAD7C7K9_9AGAR|nr:hypothetical protein FB45DRAFT_354522 [Roridomyces roridus]